MKLTYDFWNKALAGYKVGGPELPVHADVPHPGFYRKRIKKGGSLEPVAIFESEGKLIARVGFRDAQIVDASDVWLFSCERPVTEEQYRDAVASGKWHDVDEAVTASIGHNAADDTEALADQINTVLESVAQYDVVDSDEEAAKAQSVRSRLNELARDADKQREAEKKPHFEAAKKVDAIWMPLVKAAKSGANQIAAAIAKFETGKIPKVLHAPTVAAELNNEAPQPTQVRGGYGRAGSVREVRVIQEIVSYDALWARYRTKPEVQALLHKLAQRDLDEGIEVAGIKWAMEVRIR